MRDGKKVRIFPRDLVARAPKAQHKSHIPKVMFIVADSGPDPDHDFDGKLGIWRVSKPKTAQKRSKQHGKEETYSVDTTLDA